LFERGLFDAVGPLDTTLGRLEDWDWLLRHARHHILGFLAQPMARVTASSHRDTTKVLAAIETMWRKHAPCMPARIRVCPE
jgi:hypothetical protein